VGDEEVRARLLAWFRNGEEGLPTSAACPFVFFTQCHFFTPLVPTASVRVQTRRRKWLASGRTNKRTRLATWFLAV